MKWLRNLLFTFDVISWDLGFLNSSKMRFILKIITGHTSFS